VSAGDDSVVFAFGVVSAAPLRSGSLGDAQPARVANVRTAKMRRGEIMGKLLNG
jgi:hypothetical protein